MPASSLLLFRCHNPAASRPVLAGFMTDKLRNQLSGGVRKGARVTCMYVVLPRFAQWIFSLARVCMSRPSRVRKHGCRTYRPDGVGAAAEGGVKGKGEPTRQKKGKKKKKDCKR